jgi:hypothetical protein
MSAYIAINENLANSRVALIFCNPVSPLNRLDST